LREPYLSTVYGSAADVKTVTYVSVIERFEPAVLGIEGGTERHATTPATVTAPKGAATAANPTKGPDDPVPTVTEKRSAPTNCTTK
jgi:hypothetical protein